MSAEAITYATLSEVMIYQVARTITSGKSEAAEGVPRLRLAGADTCYAVSQAHARAPHGTCRGRYLWCEPGTTVSAADL